MLPRSHKFHPRNWGLTLGGYYVRFLLWLLPNRCIQCLRAPPVRNLDGTRQWYCWVCDEGVARESHVALRDDLDILLGERIKEREERAARAIR